MNPTKTTVVTFPIGVRSYEPKVGLLFSTVVAQIIARRLGARFITALNSLDSFHKERAQYMPAFVELMGTAAIRPDEVWLDENYLPPLTAALAELLGLGAIREEMTSVNTCDCGKVQMLTDAIVHKEARQYGLEESQITCLSCQKPLATSMENSLVFQPGQLGEAPQAYPRSAPGRVKELWGTIEQMRYLISRSRDTGVHLTIGNGYNIDIDSTWLQYLSTLPGEEFVLVGSNHVAWHLCLASAYLRILKPEVPTQVVLTPYVTGSMPAIANELCKETLSLYLLLNLNWGRHESPWSEHMLKFISRVNAGAAKKVWRELNSYSGEADIASIVKELNPQNLVAKLNRKENNDAAN